MIQRVITEKKHFGIKMSQRIWKINQIQVAGAGFRGPLLNPKSCHVRGISICLRKYAPSAYMIIHILLIEML